MSIQIGQLRTQLKSVISNLVTSTTVAVVYDYYEPNISAYPAIVFDITSNTDAFFTNKENIIKIVFTAYILVAIQGQNIETAKDTLDTVTDTLITELRKESNLTLGGYVDWVTPAVGPRSQVETTNGQVYSQQLDITVNATGFVN